MSVTQEETVTCTARRHGGSYYAYRAGCRHPEARTAYDAYLTRKSAEQKAVREARVKRATGGRLSRDPRRPWRNERTRVTASGLVLLLCGVAPDPTSGEVLAAVIRLERRRVVDGQTAVLRPLNTEEIGRILGVNASRINRAREMREQFRRERTLRRLAGATWRAAIRAEAEQKRLGHDR